MAAEYSAEEILDITEGRLALGMMPDGLGSICTDTRSLKEGQWFLALTGRQFNGHDFLGDAFSAGAIGCIVEERTSYPIAGTAFPLLAVGDTRRALFQLAKNWRKRINLRIALIVSADVQSGEIINAFEKKNSALLTSAVVDQTAQIAVLRDADWFDIANELLELDERKTGFLIEFTTNSAQEILPVTSMITPDMVLLPANSLSHLRIQTSAEELGNALVNLIRDLAQQQIMLVASDRLPPPVLAAARKETKLNLLVKNFDQSEELAAEIARLLVKNT